jgi:hypothetical protein
VFFANAIRIAAHGKQSDFKRIIDPLQRVDSLLDREDGDESDSVALSKRQVEKLGFGTE